MYKKKKELELKKHSAMVQMSNIVTSQQRKIFNSLIYLAREVINKTTHPYTFEVDLKRVEELTGIKSTNKKRFKESIKELMDIKVEYNILDKDNKENWGAFVLLSWVNIKDGLLQYSFPPPIVEAIRHPSIYTLLDLTVIRGLESKYSIVLYELAQDYINVEIPEMPIEVFRKLMGIEENQYKNSKDLKRRVIDPATKEVTKKTELVVTYDLLKKGRKVTAIKLHAHDSNLLEYEDRKKKELEELLVLLPPELMKQESLKAQLKKFIDSKGSDYVRSNIIYSLKNAKTNIESYLQKALENDWAEGKRVREAALKCRQQKEAEKLNKEKEQLQQKKELDCQIAEYLDSLTEEQIMNLKEEAISFFDEDTIKNSKKFNMFEKMIELQMKEIVGKKFKEPQTVVDITNSE